MHDDILTRATERNAQHTWPYRGAVTPEEAHALASSHQAVLVDVRYPFELEYVGKPAIAADMPHVPWRVHDGTASAPNPDFVGSLAQAVPDKRKPILFLCRSGIRSRHAAKAATEAGYQQAYDILDGFEGEPDAQGQRNKLAGWRARGLPWRQG
jgi:rhodanese-related sulfurtransferase